MRPNLVILQSRKKLPALEKDFFEKNSFQLICGDMIFKTVCGFFLKKSKWVLGYLSFGSFKVPKNCSSQ